MDEYYEIKASPFGVNTTSQGNQEASGSAALANGNVVAVWLDNAASPRSSRAQILDPSGAKIGPEIDVGPIIGAKVTALSGGGFLLSCRVRPRRCSLWT